MMKNYRYLLLLVAVLICGACDKYNYTDSLQGLGKRVEDMEASAKKLNDAIDALNQIVVAIENEGYVTKVEKSADGTYKITFNDGKTVTLRNGTDGVNGEDKPLLVGAAKGEDGRYYWIVNGQVLRDKDGNPVPAGAIDGSDGKDGVDGKDGADGENGKVIGSYTIPTFRINPVTRTWEISNDGGKTWENTGVAADGKDDMFLNVEISSDRKSITFILRDGRRFTVPLQ
jgi:hypothetical protein